MQQIYADFHTLFLLYFSYCLVRP